MAVFKKTMRKHIFLHPMDRKRQKVAVRSALLQDKKKYSDKLEGALLDVNNLKIVNDQHLLVGGHLSMEVIADFLVFSPRVGQTLEGVINKRSRGHLGCLVLDTFNASLAVPFSSEFDPQVGDNCTFSVTEVSVDGEIMFLRGTLTGITSSETDYDLAQETDDIIQDDFKEPESSTKRATEEIRIAEENHGNSSKNEKNSPSKIKNKNSPIKIEDSHSKIKDKNSPIKIEDSHSKIKDKNSLSKKDNSPIEIEDSPKKKKNRNSLSKEDNSPIEIEDSPKKKKNRNSPVKKEDSKSPSKKRKSLD